MMNSPASRLHRICELFFEQTEPVGLVGALSEDFLQDNPPGIRFADSRCDYNRLNPVVDTPAEQLQQLPAAASSNLLCGNIWDELAQDQVIEVCRQLLAKLQTGGVLIVQCALQKSTQLPPDRLIMMFESLGGELLHRNSTTPVTAVFRRRDSTKPGGLLTVQRVLVDDAKSSTYKYALIRALCYLAMNEAENCVWHGSHVWVPAKRVALCWIRYYWPFCREDGREHLRQLPGKSNLAVQTKLSKLSDTFSLSLNSMDNIQQELQRSGADPVLKGIADTILLQPVRYAGKGEYNLFKPNKERPVNLCQKSQKYFGVPAEIWRDLTMFNHWIEESITVRWAEQIVAFSADSGRDPVELFAEAITVLRRSPVDERATGEVRELVAQQKGKLPLLWSSKQISRGTGYEVDHLLPWSVLGNNDLWNLIPADKNKNRDKRDRIPLPDKLENNAETLFYYWELYSKRWHTVFNSQLRRFHGVDAEEGGWQTKTLRSLQVKCEQLVHQRGLLFWGE